MKNPRTGAPMRGQVYQVNQPSPACASVMIALTSDLSNLRAVSEVDRQLFVLSAGQLDDPLFTHRLTVALGFDNDLVAVPNLAIGQPGGRVAADLAGLLGFDTSQGNLGVGRNAERQACLGAGVGNGR